MKVLFIYPIPPPEFQDIGIQQGIAYLSAVLKQEGHKTSLIMAYQLDKDFVEHRLKEFDPDLIAISSTSNQFMRAKSFVKFIKRELNLNVPIIMGGVHATLLPLETIKVPDIIGLCRGEGEYALLELVEAMEHQRDWTKIPNLWVKVKVNGVEKIIRNKNRPYIADLDSLPFPDRDIFVGQPLGFRMDCHEFIGSRGCANNCTNCFHAGWKNAYSSDKGYVRFKSARYLVAEIKDTFKRFPGLNEVGFHDPSFTANREWTINFCRLYEKEVGLPFWCNSRADTLDEELLHIMKRAGCYEMHVGVESGNYYVRNAILHKGVSDEDIIHAFDMLRNSGIKTWSFNMVGLPYENEDRIWQTILLNRKIKADRTFCSVFAPYPGTYLWNICRQNGWMSERTVETYFDHTSTLNLPDINHERVSFYHDIFKFAIQYPKLLPLWTVFHYIPIGKKMTLNDGFRFFYQWLKRLKEC